MTTNDIKKLGMKNPEIPPGAIRVDCTFRLSRKGEPTVTFHRRGFEPEKLGSSKWPAALPAPDAGYYPVTRLGDQCPEWATAFVEKAALDALGGGGHSARMQYITGQMAWD